MKDNFSSHSEAYARFRPRYPSKLFEDLGSRVLHRECAWDCGTGNGQVASELAGYFENVYATDISQSQIDQAKKARNVHYSVQKAEKTSFPDRWFDLIMVAQAIHWFDFDRFYAEVRRTAKPGALLCVVGYGLAKVSPEMDRIVTHFYKEVIGPYWDQERRYIDEAYETIPFPFDELQAPTYQMRDAWTLSHFVGYVHTWSAVKHFTSRSGYDPVADLEARLTQGWRNDEVRDVEFPVLLRLGRIGRSE